MVYYQKKPSYVQDGSETKSSQEKESEGLDGIVVNNSNAQFIEGKVLQGKILEGRKLEGRKLYGRKLEGRRLSEDNS